MQPLDLIATFTLLAIRDNQRSASRSTHRQDNSLGKHYQAALYLGALAEVIRVLKLTLTDSDDDDDDDDDLD